MDTKYISVLLQELNKKYPTLNALWNYDDKNTLDSDWLITTPINCLGKKYEEFPMPIKGDDPDFGLKQCDDLPEAVELEASIKKPGDKAKKFMPGHSYRLIDEVYKLIISAEKFVDITTLSPFTGYFLSALRNALTYISNKEESKRPIIRILYSNPWPNIPPLKVMDFLAEITRDIDKNSKMEIYVSILCSSSYSWNHSKIITVDGTRSIVGGHNMWGQHYLDVNPVFDVSMKINGASAMHAHCYADSLWDYMINSKERYDNRIIFDPEADLSYEHEIYEQTLHGSYKFNKYTNKNEIKTGTYPDKNIFKNIKSSLVSQSSGNIPVLAIGRRAHTSYLTPNPDTYLTSHDEPSDDTMIKLVSLAKKNIRMSLQSFQLASGWIADYNNKLFIEFGKAIQRGVNINIVLSNPGSIAGELTKSSAPYDGDSPDDVNAKLLTIMTDELHMAEITSKNLINTYFKVASIRFSSDKTYPKNVPIPNHAKTFMVDDTAFYIGSQNQYICNLNEFGYVVEDVDKAQEYINSYFNPLWDKSNCTVSTTFSKDVANAEKAEAMLFILELKKNKRLKAIWDRTLSKQKIDTSDESIAEIKEELNTIILNAGFVTNEKRVAEMLNTAFFKENIKDNLPSSESDRFVKELLTNKQLVDDFLKAVDTQSDSFEKSDEIITEFLKSKGYNCNSYQVIASFNQLRNHMLEYWSGNYYTWCEHDGGSAYNDANIESKAKIINGELNDVKVFEGPKLSITGNLDVAIDDVKIVNPNYSCGVLSWKNTDGNNTSGMISFGEISRPALIDNYVGSEFFGVIIFPDTGDELKKGKLSYYGRIHDRNNGQDDNHKYNYLWFILSALGALAVAAIAVKCRCGCKSLRERDEYERERRHKKNEDEIELEELEGRNTSREDKAERELDMGKITQDEYKEKTKRNDEIQESFNQRDNYETNSEEVGTTAFEVEVFDTISDPEYSNLSNQYGDKIRELSKELPWDYCQNQVDEVINQQIKEDIERRDIDLANDKEVIIEQIDMPRVREEAYVAINDFVYSSITSEFPELSESQVRAVLATEAIFPKQRQIIASDGGSSYLIESTRVAVLKEKDHYLNENASTILQEISDISSTFDKTQGELDRTKEELSKVQKELEEHKDDHTLIEREKELDKEIQDLVYEQKKESEKLEELKNKDSSNEAHIEQNERDKADVDKRKTEKGHEVFKGGI